MFLSREAEDFQQRIEHNFGERQEVGWIRKNSSVEESPR